jgi:hypothetical protein
MWQRDALRGDPHTSYHASGRFHQKTSDTGWAVQQRRPLDESFVGSEMVMSTPVVTGEARLINVVCKPEDFDEVFEIPEGSLKPRGLTAVNLHVIDKGHPLDDLLGMTPGVLLKQQVYCEDTPQLVASLIDSEALFTNARPMALASALAQ